MKNFIYKNKKYLITVLVYLIAVLTVWSIRDNFLYSHIPLIIRKMKYTHTILILLYYRSLARDCFILFSLCVALCKSSKSLIKYVAAMI